MSDLKARFFAKIAQCSDSDCILWTASRNPQGYGQMSVGQKTKRATHVSWFIKYGVWPETNVLHRCDNPPCVNPEHLFLGSHADNAHDRDTKGRHKALRGEDAPWAKLTDADVVEILALTETRMSLEEIAAQYGVTPTYISGLRHGRTRTQPASRTRKPKAALEVEINGRMMTVQEISDAAGVTDAAIRSRMERGVSGEDLLAKPHEGPRKKRKW